MATKKELEDLAHDLDVLRALLTQIAVRLKKLMTEELERDDVLDFPQPPEDGDAG